MSKAFTLDDVATPEVFFQPVDVNQGAENYITRKGFESLKAEVEALQAERNLIGETERPTEEVRLRELEHRILMLLSRIDSAYVIDPELHTGDRVVFGSTVTVEGEEGDIHVYQLVGTDETDPKVGKISYISPVGKALLRARVGDFVIVSTPRGEEEIEVKSIEFKA